MEDYNLYTKDGLIGALDAIGVNYEVNTVKIIAEYSNVYSHLSFSLPNYVGVLNTFFTALDSSSVVFLESYIYSSGIIISGLKQENEVYNKINELLNNRYERINN